MDVGSLSDAELGAAVVAVQQERARLAVEAATLLREWERRGGWRSDGSLWPDAALGRDTRCSRASARVELRRARALEHWPHVRRAIVAGELSLDHLDLLCRFVTPARADLFADHEPDLVGHLARLVSFEDARRMVRYWAAAADDVLGAPPPERHGSRVYRSRCGDTGELRLDGWLDTVDAEVVTGELDRLARQVALDDIARGVQRTPAQRRAAALVTMAARSKVADGVARPLFEVVVGDDTLRRLCELASGHVVGVDELTTHLDAAVVGSIIFDGPTRPLASVQQRSFTGALRRAIQVRDRRCQHPSVCDTPASRCDIDHILPAAHGGATAVWNGRALCPAHNRHPDVRDRPPPPTPYEPHLLDGLRARLRWHALNTDDP